jgi:hypothetical protein
LKKNCNLKILQLKTQKCVFSCFYRGVNKTSLLWDITRPKLSLFTDVSGQPIGRIFNGKAVQDCYLEDRICRMYRKIGKSVNNYQITPR